jgi:hypothetical protein
MMRRYQVFVTALVPIEGVVELDATQAMTDEHVHGLLPDAADRIAWDYHLHEYHPELETIEVRGWEELASGGPDPRSTDGA